MAINLLASTPILASTDCRTAERCIEVSIADRHAAIYRGGVVRAVYPVAVGKPSHPTPTGTFAVLQKIVNPVFVNPFTGETVKPGTHNPMGIRAIVIHQNPDGSAIALHGTNTPSSIGKAVSHGCIRFRNSDIEQLFDKINIGDLVVIK